MTTLFYWSGSTQDYEVAKALSLAERSKGKKAFTRDAYSWISGDAEECDRVVFLPSVRPSDIARITADHKSAVIEVIKEGEPAGAITPTPTPQPPAEPEAEKVEEPPEPEVKKAEEIPKLPLSLPQLKMEQLRRLTNRQLRELVDARGVQCSHDASRWDIIRAIQQAQKEP
jgi:hypothetical protein